MEDYEAHGLKAMGIDCTLIGRSAGYLHPGDGEDVAADPVADHPAHDCLGDVADRLGRVPHIKQKEDRIFDPVLNDPLDIDHIEVSRQHEGFAFKRLAVGRILCPLSRADDQCPEASIFFFNPAGGSPPPFGRRLRQ